MFEGVGHAIGLGGWGAWDVLLEDDGGFQVELVDLRGWKAKLFARRMVTFGL